MKRFFLIATFAALIASPGVTQAGSLLLKGSAAKTAITSVSQQELTAAATNVKGPGKYKKHKKKMSKQMKKRKRH